MAVELALAEGKQFGGIDFVDGVAFQFADWMGLGNYDDVFACTWSEFEPQRMMREFWDNEPRSKPIMPKMPAIPSTLCVPKSFPSCSLKSPEGRSTTNEGAEGFEGEEKAYWEGEEWTLMSQKGKDMAIVGQRHLTVS